jgi:hypothetical protein
MISVQMSIQKACQASQPTRQAVSQPTTSPARLTLLHASAAPMLVLQLQPMPKGKGRWVVMAGGGGGEGGEGGLHARTWGGGRTGHFGP